MLASQTTTVIKICAVILPKEIAKSSRFKIKQDKFMYLHSSHLRDEDLFQRRNCRISSTVQIVLPAQLKLPFNGNFSPDFQVQGSFVHGSKSWAIGTHLSLLAAFRGLTWCSSQVIKAGPRMPALPSWMFHNGLQSTGTSHIYQNSPGHCGEVWPRKRHN